MKKIIILTLLLSAMLLPIALSAPTPAYAQLGCGEGFGIVSKLLCKGAIDDKTVGITLNKVIGMVVNFLTIVAGLWFLVQFITGGLQWIGAGGDKNNTTAARDKITNSLIGLIIVVIAWAVVGIIGNMLGLDIMNPGKLLPSLKLK